MAKPSPESRPLLRLLVLAQTPPPVHGQSLAVQALFDHLRKSPDWEIHHVNLRVSRDTADIGRWRLAKLFSAVAACVGVWRTFLGYGRMPIYYVPAPGKRSALYRDWIVLGLCRPFARTMIFHWHGVGLGVWLDTHASQIERIISHWVLGDVELSIAQAEAGRIDCERLAPRRCIVVRNGVEDTATRLPPRVRFGHPCEVLFVGLGTREKGLFDALAGVALANATEPGAFRFTAVGAFASQDEQRLFRECATAVGNNCARHLGFVSETERNALLNASDILCFPSYYRHEGQPAVLLEALAHDLPIVTTRWRGIPENLPASHVYFVEPQSPDQIAAQLRIARDAGPSCGASREHYLAYFTKERHLAAVEAALRSAITDAARPAVTPA